MSIIRKITGKDVNDLFSLMIELNNELNEEQNIKLDTVIENIDEMFKLSDIYENYVYEVDNKIIGFLSIIFYKSIFHIKGSALINELIVSKNFRNKGIGKKLLDFAINRAKEKGYDEIEVGVMKDNLKAIEFYKRNGITEEYLLLGKEFNK